MQNRLKQLPIFRAMGVICGLFMTLSSQELTQWNPGIPGGIPEFNLPVYNIQDYGALSDSSADASPAIESAIAAAQSGGIIYFPAGKYRVDDPILVDQDSIIIRGAGPEETFIYSGAAGRSIEFMKTDRGEWQVFQSLPVQGSTYALVTDPGLFRIGQFAEVQQDNDSLLMYTDSRWKQSWAESAVGQLFEITDIRGDTLYFANAFHYAPRSDLNPLIRPQNLMKYNGVESLYIEKTEADDHTISIRNSAYCWVQEVHSNRTRRAHVNLHTTLGCEIRRNFFHHSLYYGGGGSAYGVEALFHSTDILVEDNIFYHLRHAMMVHVGAVGNVFAYNYSTDAVQGEHGDEQTLNQGWVPPDISLHGHYAQYNLFEANVVEEIGIADYWGPMGPGNTFYQNIAHREGVYINDYSHYQNLMSNHWSQFTNDGTSENLFVDSLFQEDTLSYYLDSRPDFWWDDLAWPVRPQSLSDTLLIPAAKRWERGEYFYQPREPMLIKPPILPEVSVIKSSTHLEIYNQRAYPLVVQVWNHQGQELIQSYETQDQYLRIAIPGKSRYVYRVKSRKGKSSPR